jgi:hypothetical protein
MRADPETVFDRDRHRRSAEELFEPVRPEDGVDGQDDENV